MKRIILISIPIITIALFILIMNSSFLFMEPGGYNVAMHMELIEDGIMKADWNTVDTELERMNMIMKNKIYPYMQFSAEMDELKELDLNISKMRGCIAVQDQKAAMIYINALKNNWEHLNQ